MIDVTQTLVVNDSVVCAELDLEAVLLNIESGMYFGLDSVGLDIWKLLEHGAVQAQIVEQLLEEYDVEPAQLRADVDAFVEALLEKGLLRKLEVSQ